MFFRENNHYSFISCQNPPKKCCYYSVNSCFDKVSLSDFKEVEIWIENAIYGDFLHSNGAKRSFVNK